MCRKLLSGPIIRVVVVAAAAVLAVAMLDAVLAQSTKLPLPALQQQPAATRTPSQAAATPLAPIGLLSPTVAATQTAAASVTVPLTDAEELGTGNQGAGDSNATPNQEAETISAGSAGASAADQAPESFEAEPLSGTIVSNRTNYAARFFLEGQLYRIEPFASAGLEIPRSTSVLTLYTCDAETPETQDDCYWDPYLLQQDGFYEIVDESVVVGLPSLMIQDANAPPEDQVWIHNRTGITESVVFQDVVHEVSPGAVQEFDVEVGAPVIVYVRSCGSVEGAQACEWAPANLDTGAYFAMVEVSTPGGIPGSRITTIDLRPVLDAGGETLAAPASVACELRVPALNIRSGPGLQYEIVGKIRGEADDAGQVSVTGRSADGLWFAVAESVAANGWVTSNDDFMACRASANDLPIAEFTGAPLAPTAAPAPVAAATPVPPQSSIAEQPADVVAGDGSATADAVPAAEPQPAAEDPSLVEEPTVDAADVVSPTAESPGSGIPEGLAMLILNNGFQYPIRFTVDQRYRPIEGPSEFDLDPGASTNVVVFPGTVAFTASSPWNGLSGNADLEVGTDQSAVMWLRFEPEPDDSSQWRLAWE